MYSSRFLGREFPSVDEVIEQFGEPTVEDWAKLYEELGESFEELDVGAANEVDELQTAVDDYRATINDLEDEAKYLRDQVWDLQQEVDDLEKEVDDLHNQLND